MLIAPGAKIKVKGLACECGGEVFIPQAGTNTMKCLECAKPYTFMSLDAGDQGSDAAKCKGCGANIHWVKMESGAAMPVDPLPLKMVILEAQAEGKSPRGKLVEARVPHWATCPKRKEFKKGGKRGKQESEQEEGGEAQDKGKGAGEA